MKWTKREVEYLKQEYNKTALSIIASQLKRTEASVSGKAKQLGIRVERRKLVKKPKKRWSLADINKLVENYPKHTAKELATILDRNEKSILKKAWELGITKHPQVEWTDKDLSILYGNNHKSSKEIAQEMGRSEESIRAMRRKIRRDLK